MVDSQRRLYSLGLFNEVNMAVQNPEGLEPSKDVLFNLQEAKRWTFRYGGGIEFATGNIPLLTIRRAPRESAPTPCWRSRG